MNIVIPNRGLVENENPQRDAYEEAQEKAAAAQIFLEKFYQTSSNATEEEKEKGSAAFSAAWKIIQEIQMMGFPVEFMTTYYRPYDDFFNPLCAVGVKVLRPPGKNASKAARDRYDAWYKQLFGFGEIE